MQDMRVNGLTIENAKDRVKWNRLSRKQKPGLMPVRRRHQSNKTESSEIYVIVLAK